MKKVTKKAVEINWKNAVASRTTYGAEISISINEKTNKKGNNKCYLNFQESVTSKMGWKSGDKFLALYNPDNELEWMIVKSNSGCSLGKCGNKLRLAFYSHVNLPVGSCKCDYTTQKDKIILSIKK